MRPCEFRKPPAIVMYIYPGTDSIMDLSGSEGRLAFMGGPRKCIKFEGLLLRWDYRFESLLRSERNVLYLHMYIRVFLVH